jgi:DNA end-binding protein Ku
MFRLAMGNIHSMQTVWRGVISFGLVSIPVRLHAATEEHSVAFRQVHAADGGRVRYRRVCEKDGAEVPYAEVAKGYELPDGGMIVLTDEDFANLPLPTNKAIEVLEFVPAEQVDALWLTRGYYLRPDATGAKPYVLLRDAMVDSGRVAIVKIALRNRESLAMLRTRDDVLVLQMMLWPDEVRAAEGIAPDADVAVRPQELAMASSYIQTLSDDFNPDAYTDSYRHAVEELVAAKAAGRELEPVAEPETGQVVDLMAALRASVEAAKKSRGEREAEPKAEAGGGSGRGGKGTTRRTSSGGRAGDAKKKPAAKKPTRRKSA